MSVNSTLIQRPLYYLALNKYHDNCNYKIYLEQMNGDRCYLLKQYNRQAKCVHFNAMQSMIL